LSVTVSVKVSVPATVGVYVNEAVEAKVVVPFFHVYAVTVPSLSVPVPAIVIDLFTSTLLSVPAFAVGD